MERLLIIEGSAEEVSQQYEKWQNRYGEEVVVIQREVKPITRQISYEDGTYPENTLLLCIFYTNR